MKTKTKPSTAKLLFFLIFPPLVFLVLFFLFVLGGYTDIKRSIYCGPSESITKPMAEAIVREINKRGAPNKIVKLDSLKNLPYGLVECEKEVLDIHKFRKKGVRFESKQTCYFNINNQKYLVRLEYEGLNGEDNNLLMKGRADIYIHIRKASLDFTEVMYRVKRYIRRDNKTIFNNKWNIRESTQTNYSKKTKGLCRYKSPIHL